MRSIEMKSAVDFTKSGSKLVPVALAVALLVFGIVMCAVAASPGFERPPGAATAPLTTLYVEGVGDRGDAITTERLDRQFECCTAIRDDIRVVDPLDGTTRPGNRMRIVN